MTLTHNTWRTCDNHHIWGTGDTYRLYLREHLHITKRNCDTYTLHMEDLWHLYITLGDLGHLHITLEGPMTLTHHTWVTCDTYTSHLSDLASSCWGSPDAACISSLPPGSVSAGGGWLVLPLLPTMPEVKVWGKSSHLISTVKFIQEFKQRVWRISVTLV